MNRTWELAGRDSTTDVARVRGKHSTLRFLLRYPIMVLAFGPPQLKGGVFGVDTSQAHFDWWNVLQVAWLLAVSMRAIYRLLSAERLYLSRGSRQVIQIASLLGLVFLVSVSYSPGRTVSLEFLILYFLNLICLTEFLCGSYLRPPDWLEFLFALRSVCSALLLLVIICIPIFPKFVITGLPGNGFRLMGGTVGAMNLICPIMVIISVYAFLARLELRKRSVFFMLVGTAGVVVSQIRGAELALLTVMFVLGLQWAKNDKRAAYLFTSLIMFVTLAIMMLVSVAGPGMIWQRFSRGASSDDVLSASGRIPYWIALVQYTVEHPTGMGYIAGIRHAHIGRFAMDLHSQLTEVGGTDSAYMEVLADAGWLGLGLYLLFLGSAFQQGWRSLSRHSGVGPFDLTNQQHALRCSMLLFGFCLIEMIECSEFAIPLRQAFYIQFVIMAMILGISGNRGYRESIWTGVKVR